MADNWQSVLEKVMEIAEPALKSEKTRWTVVGSVATALQGGQITPRDIDLLAKEQTGVFHFVELMEPYTPESVAHPPDHDEWTSSKEQPISEGPDDYGFYWTFARWMIDGVKVEIAHIVGPEAMRTSQEGAGIWEAGPEIWPHIRRVSFRGHRVPVVPLEIQLGTSLGRGLDQRVAEIVRVLDRDGYDEMLIGKALSPDHYESFERLISAELS